MRRRHLIAVAAAVMAAAAGAGGVAVAVAGPRLSERTERALTSTDNIWVCEDHVEELVEHWADNYGVRVPGVMIDPNLRVRGLYDMETGIIWLRGCGPIAIAAHEFAHHIQNVLGAPTWDDTLAISAPFCDLDPDCVADPDAFLLPSERLGYPRIIEVAANCIGEQILGHPAVYASCSNDARRDLAARMLTLARDYHTPSQHFTS